MIHWAFSNLFTIMDIAWFSFINLWMIIIFFPTMAILAIELLWTLSIRISVNVIYLPFFTLLWFKLLSFGISSKILYIMHVRTLSSSMTRQKINKFYFKGGERFWNKFIMIN